MNKNPEPLKDMYFIIDTRKDGVIRLINPEAVVEGVENTGEFFQLEHEKKATYNEKIKSAVEWLKENMKKDELKHFTWRVEQLIEKAFEDVIKKESSNWMIPMGCPKCKGKKTFQEGYCSKCTYDVS